jgi:alcohol dehydrogenase class IV
MSTKVICQSGAIEQIATLFPDRRAYVVVFAQADTRLKERVSDLLRHRLEEILIWPDRMPEVHEVEFWQARLWVTADHQSHFVLAIGGGSVLDAAKVMRFSPIRGLFLEHQLDRPMVENRYRLPLVLCPTTAGTGSEVTRTATIWDFGFGRKHSFFGPTVGADVAVVDPELTLSSGAALTRSSAVDALSHALESIWNKNRDPNTISLAVSAAQNILESLPLVLRDPYDLTARERLSLAALWAGHAIAVTQTSLAHALSYDDTIQQGTPHGDAVGRWLPLVYQMARETDPDCAKHLSRALGPAITSAKELAFWLECIGIETINPYQTDEALRRRIAESLNSSRGKTFSGGLHASVV